MAAEGVGRHLLLIDDLPEILETLQMFFEARGYSVSTAETGAAGIQAYRSRIADCVILDLGLPDMTGIQVLEALRKYDATVVMLTGQGDIATAVQAMQLGAESFLTKPPDLPHIAATINRAIEKSDLRKEVVELRRFAPSTKKKIIRWGSTGALLVAAVVMGVLVGKSGERPLPVREVAPTCLPVNQEPRNPMADSVKFIPGAPPPVPGR
jgi:DNA-binding response OmpR family regulator